MGLSDIAKTPVSHGVEPHDLETGSSTVKDLVAGSGLSFRDHGAALLKGVPGEWRLFSVG
jgi:hypothetical protein